MRETGIQNTFFIKALKFLAINDLNKQNKDFALKNETRVSLLTIFFSPSLWQDFALSMSVAAIKIPFRWKEYLNVFHKDFSVSWIFSNGDFFGKNNQYTPQNRSGNLSLGLSFFDHLFVLIYK